MSAACTVCGSASLETLVRVPDSADAPLTLFICRVCAAIVPDYFSAWRGVETVGYQVDFHERWWRESTNEELERVVRDLDDMWRYFSNDLGEPKPDRVIAEVGAGRGSMLASLRRRGHRVIGCEPSLELAAMGRKAYALGDDVLMTTDAEGLCSALADQRIRPHVVLLWHVIEHVEQPLALLRRLGSMLDEGGCLLLQAPLPYRPYLYPPHRFFWHREAIERAAHRCGLRVRHCSVDTTNLFVTAALEPGTQGRPAAPVDDATVREILTSFMSDFSECLHIRDGVLARRMAS